MFNYTNILEGYKIKINFYQGILVITHFDRGTQEMLFNITSGKIYSVLFQRIQQSMIRSLLSKHLFK